MTAGNLCGLAIEACRRGLIDDELEFGDADGVAEFLEKMGRREGIGDLFAEGILSVEKELRRSRASPCTSRAWSRPATTRASLKGMGLGYITTARGACHLRGTFYKAELAGFIDPQITEGKAEMFVDWENRLCIMDTLIYCRFYRDLVQWPYITDGRQRRHRHRLREDDLQKVANRIVTETHRFNERARLRPGQGAAAGVDHRARDRGREASCASRRTRWSACCASTTRCAAG